MVFNTIYDGNRTVLSRVFASSALVAILMLNTPSIASDVCVLHQEQNVSYKSVINLNVGTPEKVVSYGLAPQQFGELWLPPAESTYVRPLPLVIFVHGGCWLNDYDVTHAHAVSDALANAGYAVWSIEYRRTGDQGGGWPGSYQDVLLGVKALRDLILPQVDQNAVAIVGHSAGGHLALLAATELELGINPKLVIGLAPIVDIARYARGMNSCQMATSKFMGGMPAERQAEYHAASLVGREYRFKSIALHGDRDQIVPLAQSMDHLHTRVIKGAGHFDFIHPHTLGFKALLRVLGEHL